MRELSRGRSARVPSDPRTRERSREAHAAEARGVAAVCAAEAKVAAATARRDKARADLAAVFGVDRAALLLGISTSEVRHSVTLASGQDGAE
jgi:hypothetical protein